MEAEPTQNIIDFLKQKIESYSEIIGTERDSDKNYLEFFCLLENYQKTLREPDEMDFISTVQNSLYEKNDIELRKESVKYLKVLLNLNVTINFMIGRWNAFYSHIEQNLINNPYQKRRDKIKNPFIFSCFFDRQIDDFAEPVELIIARDLYLGDIIDFTDHEYEEILKENYKTLTFKIIKRHYSAQYDEMYLHLENWYE